MRGPRAFGQVESAGAREERGAGPARDQARSGGELARDQARDQARDFAALRRIRETSIKNLAIVLPHTSQIR